MYKSIKCIPIEEVVQPSIDERKDFVAALTSSLFSRALI
jgi:hypothetical protein